MKLAKISSAPSVAHAVCAGHVAAKHVIMWPIEPQPCRLLQGTKLTADLCDSFSSYDGYLNGASKKLVANCNAGKGFPDAAATDDQAHCLTKVPIVVARYVGEPHLAVLILTSVACPLLLCRYTRAVWPTNGERCRAGFQFGMPGANLEIRSELVAASPSSNVSSANKSYK